MKQVVDCRYPHGVPLDWCAEDRMLSNNGVTQMVNITRVTIEYWENYTLIMEMMNVSDASNCERSTLEDNNLLSGVLTEIMGSHVGIYPKL
jgi:hypothetical protein